MNIGAKIRASVDSQWRRRFVRIAIDGILICGAMFLAFWLRFEGNLPSVMLAVMWRAIVLAVGIKIPVMFAFRVYQASWRHIGLGDLVSVAMACIVGTSVLTALLHLLHGAPLWGGVPRSILGIDLA